MVVLRVRALYTTFQALIHEMAKFGVIGAVAYVLTFALSNWLHFAIGVGPLTSLGVATLVAATFSYFANRHWTWRHRERSGIGREYGLFILLSAIGLAVTEVPVGISEYVLHLTSPVAYNISANLIGTALGTVWRFWSFKRWVFLESEPLRTEDAERAALV